VSEAWNPDGNRACEQSKRPDGQYPGVYAFLGHIHNSDEALHLQCPLRIVADDRGLLDGQSFASELTRGLLAFTL
jgi:hypothetical protein